MPSAHRPLSAAFALLAAAALPAQGAAEPPRLVVLAVVDQLGSWVLAQGLPHLPADGGFQRLRREGVHFPRCAYQHACTETGPGHATIGTGAPAAAHGIVRNQWWSPKEQQLAYCAGDGSAPLPELPEAAGRGPGRLLAPTLADSLKAHVPGSRVGSVAWKDRSAILMVGRAADAVAWFEYGTGRLVTNTVWAQAVPEWLRAFNAAKAIDGFFGWRWERSGPAAAYAGLVDDRPYETAHANGSGQRTLPQPLTGGAAAPGPGFYTQVYGSPVGNTMVRLAAAACLEGLSLGADAVPDLLCVSFSATDVIGHQFGPDSVEARDALLRLDQDLAQLLRHLDERVGAGRWTMFLTADHGIAPTPEWARAAGVDAGRGPLLTRARAAAEAALGQAFGEPPSGQRWIAHAGEGSLFLDEALVTARAAGRAGFRREAARVAAAAAGSAPGFAAAFATGDLLDGAFALDPLQERLRLSLRLGRCGDVQLVNKTYWLDGTTPASHGSPHAYDREVVAFACGAGVRRGATVLAPVTPGLGVVLLAHLLGIPAPAAAVDELPEGVLAAPAGG